MNRLMQAHRPTEDLDAQDPNDLFILQERMSTLLSTTAQGFVVARFMNGSPLPADPALQNLV
jgi:hypothetical protein